MLVNTLVQWVQQVEHLQELTGRQTLWLAVMVMRSKVSGAVTLTCRVLSASLLLDHGLVHLLVEAFVVLDDPRRLDVTHRKTNPGEKDPEMTRHVEAAAELMKKNNNRSQPNGEAGC